MKDWKKVIKNLLFAFVLISIGFALGKNFSQKNEEPPDTNLESMDSMAGKKKEIQTFIMVYYLHSTFRCATCNIIEKRTKEILDSEFKPAMSDGLIQWKTDDFQENETLSKKFDISASCVVVALMKGENVLYYKRLDDTWALLDKPSEFDSYIRSNILEALKMRQKEV